MTNQSRTEAEIKSYKIKTIVMLIIILALSVFAIYQFIELQRSYQALKENSDLITLQEKIIEQGKTIELQKQELDTALMLLSILVSDNDDELLPPEKVLEGLNEMATAEREKRQQQRARRKALIADIFSSSESRREAARRNILREFSNDTKLTSRILEAAQGKINLQNQNSIYQIIYILENISLQSLQSYKSEILAFFIEAENAGLIGSSTAQRLNAIKSKLEI
jgi:hypothetical protein